ncbi:MAG: hypothetical protein FWB77_03265 [Treponema sp.]|nr:hypothetical protein [Treponema sp.]
MRDEILIDKNAGISEEEQQDILDKINSMSERNGTLLSTKIDNEDSKKIVNAAKNGAVFPIAVNITAFLLLAAGGFLLFFFNGRAESQVKTGKAVYNLTERTLIEEIRKDTAEKIAAKEMEMSRIASRLGEVDDQLSLLYSSNKELTAEQIAAQERLLAAQTAFREELAYLQDERSQILEASRSREARLRAQLDERAREFAAAQQRTTGELDFAVSELDRLTNEQDRIAAVDAQVSGGLAAARDLIQNAHYDQAVQIAVNLRHFCNNNSLSSSRAFQSRRDFYNQAIDLIETMIIDARSSTGSVISAEQFELQAKNMQLQDNISEMQKTIDSLSSGGSGLTRRISELEANISALQSGSAEKDSRVTQLDSENANLRSANARLEQENTRNEQRIADLTNQLAAIRQLLTDNQQ